MIFRSSALHESSHCHRVKINKPNKKKGRQKWTHWHAQAAIIKLVSNRLRGHGNQVEWLFIVIHPWNLYSSPSSLSSYTHMYKKVPPPEAMAVHRRRVLGIILIIIKHTSDVQRSTLSSSSALSSPAAHKLTGSWLDCCSLHGSRLKL